VWGLGVTCDPRVGPMGCLPSLLLALIPVGWDFCPSTALSPWGAALFQRCKSECLWAWYERVTLGTNLIILYREELELNNAFPSALKLQNVLVRRC